VDVTRVRFVKSVHRLGFSLDEIAERLRLEDSTHCDEANGLAEHKLKDMREKLANWIDGRYSAYAWTYIIWNCGYGDVYDSYQAISRSRLHLE
jgi:DNA-binding transcriptional MerR regulator